MTAGLRARREVNYKAPVGGTGTPAWLKAENKVLQSHAGGDASPELRPKALLHRNERRGADEEDKEERKKASKKAKKESSKENAAVGVSKKSGKDSKSAAAAGPSSKSKKAAAAADGASGKVKEQKQSKGGKKGVSKQEDAAATALQYLAEVAAAEQSAPKKGTASSSAAAATAAGKKSSTGSAAKKEAASGSGKAVAKASVVAAAAASGSGKGSKSAAAAATAAASDAAARKRKERDGSGNGGSKGAQKAATTGKTASAAGKASGKASAAAAKAAAAVTKAPAEQPVFSEEWGQGEDDDFDTRPSAPKRARKDGGKAAPAVTAATTAAAGSSKGAAGPSKGALVVGGKGGKGGKGPSVAWADEVPSVSELEERNGKDYQELMHQYRRLLSLYGSLKSQKIGQLETLMEEQDKALLAAAEEAKRSEEHWKREAKTQRQAAARAKAEETQRRIKLMQDELIRAKAAVHEAEKALKLREIDLLERDTRLAELEARRQAEEEAAAAAAAQAAAAAAAAPAPSPGVALQFPTPRGAARGAASPVQGLLSAASGGAGGARTTPLLRQAAAAVAAAAGGAAAAGTPLGTVGGLRAPVNTPATAARTQPVPRFADDASHQQVTFVPGAAGTAVSRRRQVSRTPPGVVAGEGVGTPLSRALLGAGPRATPSRGAPMPRSPLSLLLPIRFLFGLEVSDAPAGRKGVLYTHRATGFTFLLGPARARRAASVAPGADAVSQYDCSDEEEEEEEVAFEPLDLGAAEKCLPEFLKEPIVFAASRKEQLVKIIFDSLAAAKTKGASGKQSGAKAAGTTQAAAVAADKENAGAMVTAC